MRNGSTTRFGKVDSVVVPCFSPNHVGSLELLKVFYLTQSNSKSNISKLLNSQVFVDLCN